METQTEAKEIKNKLERWMNYIIGFALIAVLVALFGFVNNSMKEEKDLTKGALSSVNHSVSGAIIKTNMGAIEIDFFADKAPVTVNNFIKLAESGFYDNTKFHRVVKDFMIQGGDPLSKDDSVKDRWGTGGPGYKFDDEIGSDNKNDLYTIAMANAGPNTNGSQFFINTANNNFLDTKHTVFGKVVKGMDVVMKINNTETTTNIYGEKSLPVNDVVVEGVMLK